MKTFVLECESSGSGMVAYYTREIQAESEQEAIEIFHGPNPSPGEAVYSIYEKRG